MVPVLLKIDIWLSMNLSLGNLISIWSGCVVEVAGDIGVPVWVNVNVQVVSVHISKRLSKAALRWVSYLWVSEFSPVAVTILLIEPLATKATLYFL